MPRIDNQRRVNSRRRRLRLLLVGTLLLSVCGLAISARETPTRGAKPEIGIPSIVVAAGDPTPTPTPQPSQDPQPTPSPTPTPQPESPQAHLVGSLAERIDPLVAEVPAEIGIVVALPDGTRLYEY